jgi:biotin-(acetyl-CoA carboxylase) ligase
MSRYIQLQKNDFKKMLAEYNSHLFALDKKVKFKKDNILFNAFVKGVNENGQIITNDGLERLFSFDEVEWVKI